MALVAQAADALHAAHEMGVVHRDVKPGNLLVRPNGTLVLTDFGIARSIGSAQLTAAGSVLGTASYISPEQAMGEQATRLSDVYALGVVAYQCLAGRRPFEGENPLEIAMRHVRETPPPLPPDTPPQVRAIVERAMAKDPAARWATAAAFAQVARRAAGELAAAAPARVGGPPATALPQRHGVAGPNPTPTPTPAISAQVPVGPRVGTATPTYSPRGHMTPLPGYLQVPVAPQRSSTGLIVALIVAVVLVAICVGAAIAIWQQAQNKKTNTLGSLAAVSIDQAEFVGVALAGKGD
jgi:serine/threonine-protein kinase